MSLAAVVCWIAFALFPTTYPRALYPLPFADSATLRELGDLRAADTPSNCLPSLHVALAWSLALSWRDFLRRSWARPLPIVWAVVVSACTLTTKQHYLVDIPAGLAVGVAAWWLVRRAVHDGAPSILIRPAALALDDARDRERVAALRKKVEAHQWSLDALEWSGAPRAALSPTMVRLLNQVIYIEEIARLNFVLQRDASADDDLRALYDRFADEERRHADGLRRLLVLHGARLEPPGLGNALVLDLFDALDPRSDLDAILVTVATPVFETFLDAGTIPFLRDHPALQGAAFRAFVERVCRDEAAHLALNWIMVRDAARRGAGWRGLRLLANPAIYRGVVAIPFMSLDVYSLAYRLGYDLRTLLPAFGRLWRLDERYPELARYPLWRLFRLFVACGVVAVYGVLALERAGLMFGRFWTTLTRVTDLLARALFGSPLLERRGIPRD